MTDPFDSASDEFTVLPSTMIASVPVGVVVTELEADATLIVMRSLAPEDGDVVAAESVVAEPANVDPEVLTGQAESRL